MSGEHMTGTYLQWFALAEEPRSMVKRSVVIACEGEGKRYLIPKFRNYDLDPLAKAQIRERVVHETMVSTALLSSCTIKYLDFRITRNPVACVSNEMRQLLMQLMSGQLERDHRHAVEGRRFEEAERIAARLAQVKQRVEEHMAICLWTRWTLRAHERGVQKVNICPPLTNFIMDPKFLRQIHIPQ